MPGKDRDIKNRNLINSQVELIAKDIQTYQLTVHHDVINV